MPGPKPIGIDLGTTNSAAAWVDEAGQTRMIANAEGELLTPSIVLFDDAEVVVGREARVATAANPERVALWVKRDMGAPVYSKPIRGEFLPPEVIQACILRKLKADIAHALGGDAKAVITVPAYFDEPRRKATADAGEMAGLDVLDIVNEPTAAALAFGETLGYLSPAAAPRRAMTVLVYDLGGGTFDVTLLRLAPGNIETLATDGDVQLGGYDWDLRLLNHVADELRRLYGFDPRQDPRATARLFTAAMEAKHTLTARGQARLRLDWEGRGLEAAITRERFEELTADLLERTATTTRQLLAAARLAWADVDRLLLVGGSTRMPMVPRMLQALSGKPPDHGVNPDEAVARGAALYASYLLKKRSGTGRPAFEVSNVNAHSLGIEGLDPQTRRKTNVVLLARNTRLPAKVTRRFATGADGQSSIVLQVVEGESSNPGECSAIGRTVLREIPAGLNKGWPIDVSFEYQTNGRLVVHAVVVGVGRETRLELERDGGLSAGGLARWKKAVDGSGGFEEMLLEVLGTPNLPLAVPTRAGPQVASPQAASPSPSPSPVAAAAAAAPVASPAAVGQARPASAPAARRPAGITLPAWLVFAAGHLLAMVAAAAVAYTAVSYFRPGLLPRLW